MRETLLIQRELALLPPEPEPMEEEAGDVVEDPRVEIERYGLLILLMPYEHELRTGDLSTTDLFELQRMVGIASRAQVTVLSVYEAQLARRFDCPASRSIIFRTVLRSLGRSSWSFFTRRQRWTLSGASLGGLVPGF